MKWALLILLLLAALAAGVLLGEAPLDATQYAQAFADPASPPRRWSAPRSGSPAR